MKPSICIVSHHAYGAIRGNGGFIGGVEWQTSFLARWLAKRGFKVSLITWGDGVSESETFDQVAVVKLCRADAGVRGVRFVHPRWTSLIGALRHADADVYYHNCAEAVTGQIGLWCKWNRRPFVYSVASDADCRPDLPQFSGPLEKWLYRAGLRNATSRVAQTRRQRDMLRDTWGLDSTVIPMPCPAPADLKADPQPNRVLWVGRVCPVKRPDWLLALARRLPELHFDFVGPTYGDPYSEPVRQDALQLANVTVHGAVPRERMPDLYRHASVLCCTSEYEGFPNTFLEAWSRGVPVVATVNPDNLLTEKRLGLTASSVDGLAQALKSVTSSDALRAELSRNASQYFNATHDADIVLPQFEQVLLAAATARRPQPKADFCLSQ